MPALFHSGEGAPRASVGTLALQLVIATVRLVPLDDRQRQFVAPVLPAAVVQADILHAQMLELHVGQAHPEAVVAIDVHGLVFWEVFVKDCQSLSLSASPVAGI